MYLFKCHKKNKSFVFRLLVFFLHTNWGNVLFSQVTFQKELSEHLAQPLIKAAADGSAVYVAGVFEEFGSDQIAVLCIETASGQIKWQYQYKGRFSKAFLKDILVQKDGLLLAIGEEYSSEQNAWLIQLNQQGQLVWSRKLGVENHTKIFDIEADHEQNIWIAGVITPQLPTDTGFYFMTQMRPNGTLEKGQKITASALLERFLFTKEQQQVYVSQLSGGEKRRLYLLTVIVQNPNFLILDEPTNDLDILTLNVLEDFLLNQFNGCLIIVTHDRYFMDKLVDHLFIFEGNGQIKDYNGNYTEYRELKKIEERENKKGTATIVSAPTPSVSADIRKANDSERKEFKRLEKDIEKLEQQKVVLTEKFNDVSKLSPSDIQKLSLELQGIQEQLDTKEMRWLELSELV